MKTDRDTLRLQRLGLLLLAQDRLENGGDKTVFDDIAQAVAVIQHLERERDEAHALIEHAYVHSGYHNCGLKQMTTPQKRLFAEILHENFPVASDQISYMIRNP
jgi:hypothetical protein